MEPDAVQYEERINRVENYFMPIAIQSVNNIDVDLKAYAGTTANETVEVLGYYAPNDGGGGQFYWNSTLVVNDDYTGIYVRPTSIGVSNPGRWVRVFDNFVDVKWFGAKGDYNNDDTIPFQKALDFINASFTAIGVIYKTGYDLYISSGVYSIKTPVTQNPDPTKPALFLNLANAPHINIYGDGADQSIIRYSPTVGNPNINCDVFRIRSAGDTIVDMRGFGIVANEVANQKVGKGLCCEMMNSVQFSNMRFFWLDTGIKLTDVLGSGFHQIWSHWNKYGLTAVTGTAMRPNLLQFNECHFGANDLKAVNIDLGHSLNFTSCSIEGNGTQGDLTTGGIFMTYNGDNGSNGVNVTDCYFEGNKGAADISLETQGFGTHTFTGNTFNRLSNAGFTTNNILVKGTGQSPKPKLGASKGKLVFEGNGFFVAGSYVPLATRKAIQINYSGSPVNYWEFDVVEQGNTYTGIVDAPIAAPLSFDPQTPQISEHTRVKAFGYFVYNGSGFNFLNSYNVSSVSRSGPGSYTINFANPLNTIYPCISVALFDNVLSPGIIPICTYRATSTNVVSINIYDLAGNPADNTFMITVF